MTGPRGGGASANLVDEASFHLVLHLEVQKAMRLRYCVSVVALSIEAQNGSGNAPIGPDLVQRLAGIAAGRLRGTDVVTTLSPTRIGLILIDAETSVLPVVVNRAAEDWDSAPLELEGRYWQVQWKAGASCYPQTANTAPGLVRQATELMALAQADESRRFYLPS